MLPVTIMPPIEKSVSRREFARRAAFGAASAALIPLPNLVETSVSPELEPTAEDPAQNPNAAPNLSPQSQTEADNRYHAILQEYGGRFSDARRCAGDPDDLAGEFHSWVWRFGVGRPRRGRRPTM